MNKAELIDVVAARIEASKKDAGEAVQAVVDAITEAVAKGEKVSISGFGVFEKAARPARTDRKPSTGEAIKKVATNVPRFRPAGTSRPSWPGRRTSRRWPCRPPGTPGTTSVTLRTPWCAG